MKKNIFKCAFRVIASVALIASSLALASCDYWFEDWWKEGSSSENSSSSAGGSGAVYQAYAGVYHAGGVTLCVSLAEVKQALTEYAGTSDVGVDLQEDFPAADLSALASFLKTYGTDFYLYMNDAPKVTSIPSGMFKDCTHLKKVRVSSSTTYAADSFPSGVTVEKNSA